MDGSGLAAICIFESQVYPCVTCELYRKCFCGPASSYAVMWRGEGKGSDVLKDPSATIYVVVSVSVKALWMWRHGQR